jgi:Hint module
MMILLKLLIAVCCFLLAESQNLKGCVKAGAVQAGKDYFPAKVRPTKSLYWDIKYFKTYKVLRNEIAGETFVLYQCGTTPPASEQNKGHEHFIPVPLLDGIALSSTTIIPYFELLGLRTDIKAWIGAFSSYISSPCLKKLIADGTTTVVSDTTKPENVNALKTKIGKNIVSFHNSRSAYSSLLLNVTDSSYLEASNEAIFEWIKFFAVFFNMEKEVNTLFQNFQNRYKCYAEDSIQAVDVILGGVKPKLLWAYYTNYNNVDGWDVAQCPNYYCEYANLCSASLINSRAGTIDYFGTKLFTTKDFIELAKDADYWIYSGNNWEEAYAKYKTQLDDFVSVKNKKVFDTTRSGENAWFENRLAEYGTTIRKWRKCNLPSILTNKMFNIKIDVVLQDVCAVVGTADPLHKRKFLRNVFNEKPEGLPTCSNPSKPLVSRATPCRKVVYPPGTVCFSGSNTVELIDGTAVEIRNLKLGDQIHTGGRKFHPVYSFGHFDPKVEVVFLQIYTKSFPQRPLEVSSDHLIFVNVKNAVPADSLVVGDQIVIGNNNEKTEITNIVFVTRTGAYAPFTASGTIVVSNILASNYISFEHHSGDVHVGAWKIASYHWISHMVMAPRRVYCNLIASKCRGESYSHEGLSFWTAPWLSAARWWMQQKSPTKLFTLILSIAFLLGIYIVEMLLHAPVMISIMLAFAISQIVKKTRSI